MAENNLVIASTKLPPSIARALDASARANRRTRSSELRVALEHYLAQTTAEYPPNTP